MIKIFHCGDIHLDAPFASVSAVEAPKRRAELLDRFLNMMKFAEDSRVDLVLIAGDLFDSGLVQPSTVKAICDTFGKMRCHIVITPGNHDPYGDDSAYKGCEFTENVHLFKTEQLSRIDLDDIGVSVFGYAFTSSAYNSRPLSVLKPEHLREGRVNILCAHTDIYNPVSTYASITPDELASSGFDYAALGHVHKTPEIERYGSTYAAYSGFAEGRGFDECGEGGAWIVNIDPESHTKVTFERVCLSPGRYAIRTVDITGADKDATAASMIERVISEDSGISADVSLRLVLTGDIPIEYSPSCSTIKGMLSSVKNLEIRDMTHPVYDADYLLKDMSIKGELYRMLLPKLSSGSERDRLVAALALRYGLSALTGQDIVIE